MDFPTHEIHDVKCPRIKITKVLDRPLVQHVNIETAMLAEKNGLFNYHNL